MKKFMVTIALVMTIVTSLVAGTLAVCSVTPESITSGAVVSKKFEYKFTGEDKNNTIFINDVSIAPGKTVEKYFSTTADFEVDTNTTFTVTMTAANGKTFNRLINATVYKENTKNKNKVKWDLMGNTFSGNEGCNSGEIIETYKASDAEVTTNYKVVFTWPSTDDDSDFIGYNYANAISITGEAKQIVNP